MKGYKIVSKSEGSTVAEIIANHGMTLDEAIKLVVDKSVEKEYDDDPDYIINGTECWYDDLDLEIC